MMVSDFLLYCMVRDRTKIFGTPLIAIRYIISLLFVTFLFLSMSSNFYMHCAIALLAALIVLFAYSFLLFRRQSAIVKNIYDNYYYKFGAPSIYSGSLDYRNIDGKKAKADRKIVRKRLKISWDGKRISSLNFRGEGGKISLNDVKNAMEYVRTIGNVSNENILLVDYDLIGDGVFSVKSIAKNSPNAIENGISMKIYNILDNSGILSSWDEVDGLPQLDYNNLKRGTPPFSQLTVKDTFFDEEGYTGDKLIRALSNAFPIKNGEWFVKAKGEDLLIIAGTSNSSIYRRKNYVKLIDTITKSLSNELNIFYLRGEACDVTLSENGELESFTLHFKDIGLLNKDDNLKIFLKSFTGLLKNEGVLKKWSVKNRLSTEGNIYFR